jgi:hypothetical protein
MHNCAPFGTTTRSFLPTCRRQRLLFVLVSPHRYLLEAVATVHKHVLHRACTITQQEEAPLQVCRMHSAIEMLLQQRGSYFFRAMSGCTSPEWQSGSQKRWHRIQWRKVSCCMRLFLWLECNFPALSARFHAAISVDGDPSPRKASCRHCSANDAGLLCLQDVTLPRLQHCLL